MEITENAKKDLLQEMMNITCAHECRVLLWKKMRRMNCVRIYFYDFFGSVFCWIRLILYVYIVNFEKVKVAI